MHRARTVSVVSSPLDAQTRRFRRPPTGLTVERAERGSPNSNTRGRTTVEVRTGMQIAARRHWHGVRANMTEGSAGPAGLSPTLRAHTTAGQRVNRTCPSVLGQLIPPPWDTRSISGSNIRPRGTHKPPRRCLRFRPYRPFRWGGLCVSRPNSKDVEPKLLTPSSAPDSPQN